MNDFKEYSAAFHDHQNSLMHYGVKGMKWKHHLRRLQEITGIGLKREEQQVRNGVMSAAKSEIKYRQAANSPNFSKYTTYEWTDTNGNDRSGSYKDRNNYLAEEHKADRKSATAEANKLKDTYNKSILGRIEALNNKNKDWFKGLFKKKKKK